MKTKKVMMLISMLIVLSISVFSNTEVPLFASETPTIMVESVSEAEAGQEVTLSVIISNNPGICTARLGICYDSALTLIEASDTKLLAGGLFGKLLTENPYYLTWDDSLADENNVQNGTIVTLKFRISDDAEEGVYKVWITHRADEICNLDLDDVAFETIEGSINVKKAPCKHSFVNYVSDNNATCTEDGTKTGICEKCHALDTIIDEGSKLGHDFGEWKVITQPTCESAGKKVRVCSRDENHVEEQEIEAYGHSFTNYVSNNDATCVTDGTKTAKCDHNCGAEDTIVAEKAKGHIFGEYIIDEEATVEKNGKKHANCSVCGEVVYEEIPKLVPKIVSGMDSIWNMQNGTNLIFTSDAAYTDFINVLIDEQVIGKENYTVKEGSTIVELKEDYLKKLSAGTHTISIHSLTGTASTKFIIKTVAADNDDTGETNKPPVSDEKHPQTGDSSKIVVLFIIEFISLIVFASLILHNKKKEKIN